MSERANELADELMGTCKTLEEVMTDQELEDDDLIAEIEDQTQRCETCAWWVEATEVDEEGNCTDCIENAA